MDNNKNHYNEKILQLNTTDYRVIKEYDSLNDIQSFLDLNHKEIKYIKLSCNNKINDFLGYKWIWERNKDKEIVKIPIKLINEKNQLLDIIDGININIFNMRYYCTLIIKDCYSKGITNKKDIIGCCFDWAKKNKVWIKLNIVDLVDYVLNDYVELKDIDNVYFSKDELEYIKGICGKKKNSKKLAVGMLAYFKVHSRNNICSFNIRLLCEFIGIDISSNSKSGNFYNRDLRHLLNCNFIEDIEDVQKWKNNLVSFNRKIKMHIHIQNEVGEYIMSHDNFLEFYKNIDWSKI